MNKVKRTERGWAGHFICADRCLFRRNTLLECKDIKIVVSTVGLMKGFRDENCEKFEEVGVNRFFETMVFHSKQDDERYHDIDAERQIDFESPWSIDIMDADDKANDMHEAVVDEITKKIKNGHFNSKRD